MWVQTTKECPVVVDIMGIILGVIGAIVAIGLMLILMWKVLTTIHDRREYARFEKEQRLAKWDAVRQTTGIYTVMFWRESSNSNRPLFVTLFQGENPIFKSATSTYKNPTYNGR